MKINKQISPRLLGVRTVFEPYVNGRGVWVHQPPAVPTKATAPSAELTANNHPATKKA